MGLRACPGLNHLGALLNPSGHGMMPLLMPLLTGGVARRRPSLPEEWLKLKLVLLLLPLLSIDKIGQGGGLEPTKMDAG